MLDGDPPPLSNRGRALFQFLAHIYCDQTDGWIKMALGTEIGLGPRHIVLGGEPATSPERGGAPQFSSHVHCGQTAAYIRIPLGTEVGLSLGIIVLDGNHQQPPSPKGEQVPIFGHCPLWPNGWMDEDTTWYGGRPRASRHCVR